MSAWFSDVMRIALRLWAAGVLTIVLAIVFLDSIIPAVQWVARQLL